MLKKLSLIIFLNALCTAANAAELVVPGTGDGIEILNAIGALFTAEHPDEPVLIPASTGSGGGIAAVDGERAVLGRIARPLSGGEIARGLEATPIAKLPSAFFVNPSAGVTNLTAEQTAEIYAGRIENWREVGGHDLRIKIVRREETDSTLQVLRSTMTGWKDLAITPKSKLAVTTQDAVATVKTVEGAIGFGPYSKNLEPEATVLAIDGKMPTDPSYPSAVTLSFVYKNQLLSDQAKNFIAFVQTDRVRNLVGGMGGVIAEKM